MSKRMLAAAGADGFVRFEYQGCLVKMRAADWAAALAAGKAERRALQQAAREQQGQAHAEAQRLVWIEEE